MDKDCVEGKCTCGAATEGKWADIHTKGCPALGEYSEPLAMIDAAWERHMAASTPDWPPQVSAVALPDGERRHGSTGQLFEAQSGQWVRVNPTRKQITRALEVQDALDDIDDKMTWHAQIGSLSTQLEDVKAILKVAIDVFEGMNDDEITENDDEITEDLLPHLREGLRPTRIGRHGR